MKRWFVWLLIGAGLFVGWWNYSIGPLPLAREVRNAAGHVRLVIGGFGPLGLRLRGFMVARWEPLDVSDRSFFDAEILIKSARAGYRVVEVPVAHKPRGYGRAMGLSASNVRDAVDGLSNEQWRGYVRPDVSARALRALVAQSARVVR